MSEKQAVELKACPFCNCVAETEPGTVELEAHCSNGECPAYYFMGSITEWNNRRAEASNEKRAVTLTVGQCLDAAQSCGGLDDLETEITIEKMEAWKCRETGEDMPAGLYAHLHDYPEEGLFGPLGNVQPQSEPSNERLRKAAELLEKLNPANTWDLARQYYTTTCAVTFVQHKENCNSYEELRDALSTPPQQEARLERCIKCNSMVADWVDPDWAGGRVCRDCETKHKPLSESEVSK